MVAFVSGCTRPTGATPLDEASTGDWTPGLHRMFQEKLAFWKDFFGRPLLPAQEDELRIALNEVRTEIMPLRNERMVHGRSSDDVFLCMTEAAAGDAVVGMGISGALDLTAADFELGHQPFALNLSDAEKSFPMVVSLQPGSHAWTMTLHLRRRDGQWAEHHSESVPRSSRGVFFAFSWKIRPFQFDIGLTLNEMRVQCFVGPLEEAPTTFLGNESSGAFWD